MEKISEEKLSEGDVAATEIIKKSDVPAEEIEDNNDSEEDSEGDSDSSSDSSSDSDSDDEYECTVCEKTFSGYLPFKQHQKGKKHVKAVLRKKKIKKQEKIDTVTEDDEELLVQEPYTDCKICSKEFYGPESYEQHLKSKKHKRKVLEASILDKVQEGGKINVEKLKQSVDDALENSKAKLASLALEAEEEEDDEKKENEFECKECEKVFSGLVPFTQHLTSKSHAKKVGQKNLLEKVSPRTSKEVEVSAKTKEEDLSTLCLEDDVLVCKICTTSFSGPENAITHMTSKKHAKNLEKFLRKLERKKKKAKDTDVSSDKKEKTENEDEGRTDKLQSTSEEPDRSEVANLSDNNPSPSSNDTQVAYSKYKEYKKLMNSVQESEM